MHKKILVVYYSFEGSTRLMAETIAHELKADVLELKPVKDLQSKGFMKYVRGGKQAVMKVEPELERRNKNPEHYDVIIIGTPVWAFTYTPAIRTFFSQAKLEGKQIGLFCTHEGGPGKTLANMEERLGGNHIVGEIDFRDVKKDEKGNVEKAKEWTKGLL